MLDYEIAQEQAAALGRLGRALERALAALSEYERSHAECAEHARRPFAAKGTPARARLVQAASDALWCFIIQRECCGLRDSRSIMREYGVPAEVHNRMGAIDSNPAQRLPRR